MKQLTNENLEAAIASAENVIIEFSAEWCGPCRMAHPILEEIANTTDINVFDVNVDEEIELAEKFGIRNIPTTLYYKNGVQINKTVGVRKKSEILEQFN